MKVVNIALAIIIGMLFTAMLLRYQSVVEIKQNTPGVNTTVVYQGVGDNTNFVKVAKVKTRNTYTLKGFAQAKMNDLLKSGYWDHTNSNGCDFHCRTKGYTWNGGQFRWMGENLYRGKCDISNAYRLWRLSPAHNAILNYRADIEVLLMSEYADGKCYIILEKASYK